jgi:hypothetical protein
MKKILLLVLVGLFAIVEQGMATGKSYFDVTKSVSVANGMLAKKKEAQALKAEGKWEEAAKLHPQSLCRAMYYWNAACQAIGGKDSSGNWTYDNQTAETVEKAKGLLDIAISEMNTPDEYGCTTVTVSDMQNKLESLKQRLLDFVPE